MKGINAAINDFWQNVFLANLYIEYIQLINHVQVLKVLLALEFEFHLHWRRQHYVTSTNAMLEIRE